MSIEVKISKRPISYKTAIKFLQKRVEELKLKKGKELLWILEHPLTYTAGIRSNDKEILDKKIKIIKTNRGGKITLHNPGQKIIYFVLNLNKKKKDIKKIKNKNEKNIIKFLMIYKIKGKKDKKNIGIWVNKKKIAAIGLRISKGRTYHGISLNVDMDLTPFSLINPCGFEGLEVTQISDFDSNVTLEDVESVAIKEMQRLFS